jgi:hypothetical protein
MSWMAVEHFLVQFLGQLSPGLSPNERMRLLAPGLGGFCDRAADVEKREVCWGVWTSNAAAPSQPTTRNNTRQSLETEK